MKFEINKNRINLVDDESADKSYDDAEVMGAFASALRAERERQKMSFFTLTKMTGIPHQTLSAYERRTRTPSFLQALKIACAFGLTIEEFILEGLEEECLHITE